MNKSAYMDGYLYKEAGPDTKLVPDIRTLPGYHKGHEHDPYDRLKGTYELQGYDKEYFPRPVQWTGIRDFVPKVTPGQWDALKESLPDFQHYQSPDADQSLVGYQTDPAVDKFIQAPGPRSPGPEPGGRGENAGGLPILMHEYTHAADPVIPVIFDRHKQRGEWVPTQEPELPAMVTERAAHASGYIPKDLRQHLTTMLEKQIEKYGPVIRGPQTGTPSEPELKRSTAKDLGNIKQWVHSLRRMPGRSLPVREPYAYKQDPRTGEQRASALGEAYRRWMNRQVESDPNAPVALRSMDDTVKAKQ